MKIEADYPHCAGLHRYSSAAAPRPLFSRPQLNSNEWPIAAIPSLSSRKPIAAASMSTQAQPGALEIECVPCLSVRQFSGTVLIQ